jgi:heme A synthase
MDLPTLIEYGHRLAALLVSVLVVLTAVLSWFAGRNDPTPEDVTGASERLTTLGVLAVGLLVIQIMLGAVTVWLELPPASVILHLGTAMLLLAALLVLTLEAYRTGRTRVRDGASRRATWTVVGAFVVVLLGALTANLDAGPACQGFPLCNGTAFPGSGGNPLVHAHWAHRVVAYVFVAWCVALPWTMKRARPADAGPRWPSQIVALVAVVQLAAGAAMVLMSLPADVRAAHVGLGAAVIVAAVLLGWEARYPGNAQPIDSSSTT